MNDVLVLDTEEKKISYKQEEIQYEPYELVLENDRILKRPTVPFDFYSGISANEISERMKATIKKYNGLGLAAPQCGLTSSIFVMGYGGKYSTIFNPAILWESKEMVHMEEGCLSYFGLLLNISRPKAIRVSFQDELGSNHIEQLEDLSARIFLHETDHIRGVTFDMVAKSLALKSGLKKRDKLFKKYVRNVVQQQYFKNINI